MVLNLRRHRATRAATPAEADAPAGSGRRVVLVHRIGAVAVSLFLLVFGLLGFAGGLAFFSTHGQRIAGLSSNGLLSTISVIMAAVLIAAALRGPRIASTVMMVAGVLFLLSALANLAVLNSAYNILAFRLPNVFFSIAVGLLLLLLGAYGRVSGNLPADSPYAHPHEAEPPRRARELPSTPEEVAAEQAMREAELAVYMGTATAEQRRRVDAMTRYRDRYTQRRAWMSFDRAPAVGSAPGPAPSPTGTTPPATGTRTGRTGLLERLTHPRTAGHRST
jgi:hypothetical protein